MHVIATLCHKLLSDKALRPVTNAPNRVVIKNVHFNRLYSTLIDSNRLWFFLGSYLCRQSDRDILYLFQPKLRHRIARHAPVSTWREADGADLGAVWQATAFELLLEEAAEEGVEPFLDRCIVVDACEGFLR